MLWKQEQYIRADGITRTGFYTCFTENPDRYGILLVLHTYAWTIQVFFYASGILYRRGSSGDWITIK